MISINFQPNGDPIIIQTMNAQDETHIKSALDKAGDFIKLKDRIKRCFKLRNRSLGADNRRPEPVKKRPVMPMSLGSLGGLCLIINKTFTRVGSVSLIVPRNSY